ncbi:Hypothetical protein FKW44_016011, partial [Caligus rogercresseyi]
MRQERSGKNLSTGTIMPSSALYMPNVPLGGCQRPFMFLEASGPPGIVQYSCWPLHPWYEVMGICSRMRL